MPFDDVDPFVADGTAMQFGSLTVKGNLDSPSRDLDFGGVTTVGIDWVWEFGTYQAPGLDVDSTLTVVADDLMRGLIAGDVFKVWRIDRVDDGVFSRAMLKKVASGGT